jgi:CDP-glycerol glycerophosphotransferase (TagB/SpsB family)
LIDHGTAPEKIGVIGAPFYESMIKNIDRNRTKLNFFSHFKLREATRVVTLATQPFRTEEHPDYINTYVTPKNIEDKLRITLKAIKDIDNIKLVIKLHPADTNIWFTQDIVKEEDCAGKVIILKDYSLFDILASTDLLLVGGSTVYLEALLLKIPIYIFDRSERRFLKFMSEDYLDLSNKEQAIKNLRNILKSDVLLKERLKKQEEELSWHFYNNNIGAIDNLKRLVSTD